jgi:phage terminase large subunit
MSDMAVPVDISKKFFNDVYIPHLKNYSRVQIFFGGSSSGKSVFLAERTVWDILRGGRNYLVCRQVARTLRLSVFAEVCSVIGLWGLGAEFHINKSEMLITCENGYQIAFVGLDDVE